MKPNMENTNLKIKIENKKSFVCQTMDDHCNMVKKCFFFLYVNTKCGLPTGPKFYYKRLLKKTKEIVSMSDPTSKVSNHSLGFTTQTRFKGKSKGWIQ